MGGRAVFRGGGVLTVQVWIRSATAVFLKELRSEWRSKVAVLAIALFAMCSLTLIGLSMVNGPAVTPEVASGLLWILILFTAATGLGRVFVQEEERGTGLALRLSAPGTVVWAGKFAANAVLLLVLATISTPLLLAMLKVKTANVALLICVVVLGSLGTASTFTTTAAVVATASAKGGLLPALSFPVMVVLFMAAIHGTNAALGAGNASGSFAPGVGDIQVLFSYTVISITVSLMLFDFVWGD